MAVLVEFSNRHILDDRRFLLTLSKSNCLFFVEINPAKSFTIFVFDSHKIVIVDSRTAFPFSFLGCGHQGSDWVFNSVTIII